MKGFMYEAYELFEDIVIDNVLKEDFKIESGCIKSVQSQVEKAYANGRNDGNGTAVEILCNILNKTNNLNLNPKDYILHHRNLKHNDNSLDNLFLFPKDLNHRGFHAEIWRQAINRYADIMHLVPKSSNKILKTSLQNINVDLFLLILMEICIIKTDRKELANSNIYAINQYI